VTGRARGFSFRWNIPGHISNVLPAGHLFATEKTVLERIVWTQRPVFCVNQHHGSASGTFCKEDPETRPRCQSVRYTHALNCVVLRPTRKPNFERPLSRQFQERNGQFNDPRYRVAGGQRLEESAISYLVTIVRYSMHQ
jgi:hypothetical protein